MRTFIRSVVFGAAAWGASAFMPSTAAACGGFFCNQAQPVNQAAEGIIFADNGDGTVTAVIQIQYQGPAKNFSWLLPISSVPKKDSDIGIASNLAFQRLQTATNPNYTLTTKIEGTCRQDEFNVGAPTAGGVSGSAGASSADPRGDGVTVEASGVVGAFEWTVISLDESTANPGDAAVVWLEANGYDVPSSAPKLIGPYLESGLYLLALKLTKGADSGSIRPIVLTYAGTQPSIPIKLTAVAANDDMGVLAWVLGKSRSVPKNYLSLELNEARINWFNANSNYNSVVTAAANDAGGQGFVTEFAGASSTLKGTVWSTFDEQNWTQLKGTLYQSFGQFFQNVYDQYGAWDGFWDATRAAVTLPAELKFEDFKLCPNCYADQITFMPSAYLAQIEKAVIEPVKSVQTLIDAHPEITRMYSTLSPEEMTLDPLFTFNADLPAVSNQHTAERVIECNPKVSSFEAPWRIELPQGGVIRGLGNSVGTWPAAFDDLPPNRLIVRTSETGSGKVVEDYSDAIGAQLASYNADLPTVIGNAGATGGPVNNGNGGAASTTRPTVSGGGGGCSVAPGGSPIVAFIAAAALAGITLRRRRS